MPVRRVPAARRDRSDALARRLTALEERLRRLESGHDRAGASAARGDATADRMWVLEGLKRRAAPAPRAGRAGGRVAFAGMVYAADQSHYQWIGERELQPLFDQPWLEWAGAFESLGHRVRLELLRALARGVKDVAALGALPGMGTTGQLYHHLRALVAAGWVRQLQRNHYAIVPDRMVALMVMIAAAAGPHPPEPPFSGARAATRRATARAKRSIRAPRSE
jgi:hypothetical protein